MEYHSKLKSVVFLLIMPSFMLKLCALVLGNHSSEIWTKMSHIIFDILKTNVFYKLVEAFSRSVITQSSALFV